MGGITRLGRLGEKFLKYIWMTGRIGRLQFGFRLLGILMAITVTVGLMTTVLVNHNSPSLTFLISVLFQWLLLCAVGQRTHDLGYSAWWSLLYCIPVINLFCIAVLLLLPGNKEFNEFGTPPLNNRKVQIVIVLFIILPIFSVSILDFYSTKTVHVKNITYAELLQDIEHQQVDHIIIFSDNTFRGTLKTSEIILGKIPADHSDLINTLQQQNVNIKYEEAPTESWWRALFKAVFWVDM